MCCSPAKMMHPEVLLEEARTCVQVSAMLAQNELLLCLLDHHADINSAPGTLGWSALHLCALVNNEEGAEKLLAHGAAICHWCCFQTGIFDVSNGMPNWLLLFWLRARLNSKFRIKGKLTVNPHSSIEKKKHWWFISTPKTVPNSHQKPSQTSSVFWKNSPGEDVEGNTAKMLAERAGHHGLVELLRDRSAAPADLKGQLPPLGRPGAEEAPEDAPEEPLEYFKDEWEAKSREKYVVLCCFIFFVEKDQWNQVDWVHPFQGYGSKIRNLSSKKILQNVN